MGIADSVTVLARSAAETPAHLFFSCLSGVIVYFAWSLQTDWTKFLNFLLVVLLLTNCGVALLLLGLARRRRLRGEDSRRAGRRLAALGVAVVD